MNRHLSIFHGLGAVIFGLCSTALGAVLPEPYTTVFGFIGGFVLAFGGLDLVAHRSSVLRRFVRRFRMR